MRTLGIDLAAQPKNTGACAVATGRTEGPAPHQATAATREGWIHLPTCPIEDLVTWITSQHPPSYGQ